MDLRMVMSELQELGTEQTKKTYKNHGAREPLFGVTIGAMRPLMKKTGKNYDLSMALYATGNYDAAYFAGMIAEPEKMGEASSHSQSTTNTKYHCRIKVFHTLSLCNSYIFCYFIQLHNLILL